MKKLSGLLSIILALLLVLSPVSGLGIPEADAAGGWVCSWASSTVDAAVSVASVSIQDIIPARSTIRIELKVTTGGDRLRFKFSNEYGAAAVTLSELTVAKTVGAGNASILADTAKAITFGGSSSVQIQKGTTVWSDPVDFHTDALDSLSVSIYFNNPTYITSAGLANARTFMGIPSLLGDNSSQCYAETVANAREVNITSSTITYHTTPFLCEIDAYDPTGTKSAAVFIGDSTLVNDTYYYFAEKLVNAGIKNVSVVNEAVVANKLLSDGTGIIGNLYGDALVDRFERDALNISGVKYIFVKIGLNDILHQFSKSMGDEVPHPTASDIITGYKSLVQRAHEKGIKIYFFTKTSWKGYERAFLGQTGDIVWTKEMQNMCDELDNWIKTTKMIDGYIDCSPLSNPADEDALCPSFTPDGAHLTPIASIALADLIPVSYVGVNYEIKSSAKINKVDPYEEKNQIIYDMEHPTEAPTEPPVTVPPTTTEPPEEAPGEEATTAPPASSGSTGNVNQDYNMEEIATVAPDYNNETVPYNGEMQVKPNYNVSDMVTGEIGDGVNIGFLLILFTALLAAGVVVYLTMARKKEEEFE